MMYMFLPSRENFQSQREVDGVVYHPLNVGLNVPPLELAANYSQATETCVAGLPTFDLFHAHEWISALAPWLSTRLAILSLTSIESVRCNGAEPTALSLEVQKTERNIARAFECILTPDWLRAKAISEFGADSERIHAFPMEGRLPNELDDRFGWKCTADQLESLMSAVHA